MSLGSGPRELVVLGTAGAVPTRERNHNGYVLRWDGTSVLFDPGEGIQRQMLHAGVSSPRIERICVTHRHNDHCLGVPGVLNRMAQDRPGRPVTVHGPEDAFEHLRALAVVAQANVRVTVQGHPALDEEVPIADVAGSALTARALDHRVPALGYRLTEPGHVTFSPATPWPPPASADPTSGGCSARASCAGCGWRTSARTVPVRWSRSSWTPACAGRRRRRARRRPRRPGVHVRRTRTPTSRPPGGTSRPAGGDVAARAGVRTLVLTHVSARYDAAELGAEARTAVAAAGGTTTVTWRRTSTSSPCRRGWAGGSVAG